MLGSGEGNVFGECSTPYGCKRGIIEIPTCPSGNGISSSCAHVVRLYLKAQTRKDLTKNERRNEQYLGTRVGGFCAACQYGLAHELERSATLATATSVATGRVPDCDSVIVEAVLQITRLTHSVMGHKGKTFVRLQMLTLQFVFIFKRALH